MRGLLPALAVASIVCLPVVVAAQETQEEEAPKLLGRTTKEALFAEPFSEWSQSGYDEYEPDAGILRRLRELDLDGFRLTVFFGTWCGDSRREVPHLVRLADALGLEDGQLELVAVDRGGEMHKRSPGGEDEGLGIYRVPTVIVRRQGREVARLVEYPARSLERDLLAIFSGDDYEPSYASYPTIRSWVDDGLLADGNVNEWGLADDLRHVVRSEGELAAAANVLLEHGNAREAVKLNQVNCVLFRESPSAWGRLAKAWSRAGEPAEARDAAERALRLDPDPESIAELLELIDPREEQAED